MRIRRVGALIGDIYEAALEPNLWPSVMERISDAICGTTTVFSMHDPATRYGAVMGIVRADPSFTQNYDHYYHQLNPHAQKLTQALDIGELGVGQMVISDGVLLRSEYYNDFLQRHDLFHLAGGVIARDGALGYAFATLRPHRKGEFHQAEIQPLQTMLPHLARAARISKELNKAAGVMQSFLALQTGLILLDKRGRVIVANPQAEQILNQNDGLRLGPQGQLLSHKRNSALPAKLFGVMDTSMGRGLDPGGDVFLERPSGKTPYRLSILPLRVSNFVSEWKQAVAAIFVSDPDAETGLDAKFLRKHHGVTEREAAVANLLVQGLDLNEICERLGVKKTTIRTQIRSLMDKFAVNRQVELVVKLSRTGHGPISSSGGGETSSK